MTTLQAVGYDPDEIDTAAPTRDARLKWVVVVDQDLPPGRATNAAICVAASFGRHVDGLLGPTVTDAAGADHPGLPWAGCAVLVASSDEIAALRSRAAGSEGVFVADMPEFAQSTLVYDEYRTAIGADPAPRYLAIGLIGPRNRIAKFTKGLRLMP